jgi:hypothetical protein
MRSARSLLIIVCLFVGAIALQPSQSMAATPSTNGIAGSMPAYYDHDLFTINFKPLTTAEATLQAKNGQLNVIWQSDPGLPGGQPFISVINAIPADGMNPLWVECQITFNPGHTPRQLFSDDEVHNAELSGEITVTDTHELYRCSVIGAPSPPAATFVARGTSASVTSSGAPSAVPARASWGEIKQRYR